MNDVVFEIKKIYKFGNKAGVILPKDIMKRLSLHIGDDVKIFEDNGNVIICPKKSKVSLEKHFEDFGRKIKDEEFWKDSLLGELNKGGDVL